MKKETIYIYGKHAVGEALKNNLKSVEKVFFIDKEDGTIKSLAIKNKINIERLNSKSTLPREIDLTANHQGVMALIILDKLMVSYKDFIKNLEITSDIGLVIMGELQDPQNVGAIIRSAVAFGISGILIPEHNQAPVSGTVVKVSAGMAFSIPLVSVGNINNVIYDLKDKGFWIYGLEEKSEDLLNEQKFDEPTVFVLGNEAKGIREKTRDVCDILIRIPINEKCESLNVASSTAVVLYEWSRNKLN